MPKTRAVRVTKKRKPLTRTPEEQNITVLTILTLLLLFFVFPIGVIVMWLTLPWTKKTKTIITLIPVFFLIIGIFFAILGAIMSSFR